LKVKSLLPKLAILSEYYLESRYPDQLEKSLDNRKVATKALEDTRKIYKEIAKELT